MSHASQAAPKTTLSRPRERSEGARMTSSRYHGARWSSAALPEQTEPWPAARPPHLVDDFEDHYDIQPAELREYARDKPWVMPSRTMYFFCDVHADATAFRDSLMASGGVELTGPGVLDFRLTEEGRGALFVIAGDCFDKGPHNLNLLRALGHLIKQGGDVEVLAGNHDLRTLVGLEYLGRKEPRFAHLFVRMGKKSVPLFKEILEAHPPSAAARDAAPSEAELRRLMFPPESWFTDFPRAAHGLINEIKLKKELVRIREKIRELSDKVHELGLTLRDLYLAVSACREHFLGPEGEFTWFFERMRLARRWGSFLLVHAGVDDKAAAIIGREGVEGLNQRFDALRRSDLFELYHGPIGNCFRTKYREIDYPLTERGVADMHGAGLYAIVHGHRNILCGQRMVMRRGLLNVECDASVDANTRVIEGLEGRGAAALVFRGDGSITGVSTDHARAKRLELRETGGLVTIIP